MTPPLPVLSAFSNLGLQNRAAHAAAQGFSHLVEAVCVVIHSAAQKFQTSMDDVEETLSLAAHRDGLIELGERRRHLLRHQRTPLGERRGNLLRH